MSVSEEIDNFIAENGGNARDALNVALARLDAIEKMLHSAVEETKGIRYFSFQYSFWDATKKRNRPGVWNVVSAVGFPQAEKLLCDIEAYLLTMNVNVEKNTVCLHGWQEFESQEDYENFTK